MNTTNPRGKVREDDVRKNDSGNKRGEDRGRKSDGMNRRSGENPRRNDGPERNSTRPAREIGERRPEENENIIEGRNSVMEALKAGRTVEKLYVAKGDLEGSIKKIISMAKDKGIIVNEVDRRKLDDLSATGSHQGVVAQVSPYSYSSLEEILDYAKSKGEDPFVIILDELEDPHNLGSIVRTANASGAHGVIIPKRRSALVTQTVSKASAGAVEYTRIAKVTNLNQTLKELKDRGLWVIGTDMDGGVLYESNLTGPVALVVGSEGKGISRLVKENCDLIVSLPMKGEINSLNASVAAGLVMYEVVRQRGMKR